MDHLKYAIGIVVIANLTTRPFEPEPTDTLAIGNGYVVSVSSYVH